MRVDDHVDSTKQKLNNPARQKRLLLKHKFRKIRQIEAVLTTMPFGLESGW
jgi:hypothetical protein